MHICPDNYFSGSYRIEGTPPNRVSADSPSRILPGDVLVSLRFPPPKKLQCCEWPSGNSHSSEVFFGADQKKIKGGGTTCLQGVIVLLTYKFLSVTKAIFLVPILFL